MYCSFPINSVYYSILSIVEQQFRTLGSCCWTFGARGPNGPNGHRSPMGLIQIAICAHQPPSDDHPPDGHVIQISRNLKFLGEIVTFVFGDFHHFFDKFLYFRPFQVNLQVREINFDPKRNSGDLLLTHRLQLPLFFQKPQTPYIPKPICWIWILIFRGQKYQKL